MTTLDARTGPPVPDPGPEHFDLSAPPNDPDLSTLELLRRRAEEGKVDFAPCELFAPSGAIKLVCSTDLPLPNLQALQKAAIPAKEQKRQSGPRPFTSDNVLLYGRMIARQCQEVWVERDGPHGATYVRVNDRDGQPLTFSDPVLLAHFNAAESTVAIKAVFGGSDAHLVRAGLDLQSACGWGEDLPDGGEDEDPR